MLIIDVREPFEYASGHVEGAINVPPSQLLNGAAALSDIAKDEKIIVYCRSGARSASAIALLRDLGFTHLHNGINAEHVRAKLLH